MIVRAFAVCVAGIVFSTVATAQPMNPEARFGQAIGHLQSGRYAEAIPILEELVKTAPNAANVYWNLGLAEEALGAPDKALSAWVGFHRLEPNDWRGREKLVQAYEATGRDKDAERERDALVDLWRQGADKDLRQQKYFCREILKTRYGSVAALEYFDTKGDTATYFTFAVQSGERSGARLSLNTDTGVESKMRAAGRLAAEEHLFVLALSATNVKETYHVYKRLPSYAALRKDVVAALSGESKPLSSLSVNAGQPTLP
jgi:Tetratricopeptide repeat